MTWWLRGGRWHRAPRRPARVPERPFLRGLSANVRGAHVLLALLQAVVRVAKCKLFGHAFEQIVVPVSIEAFERFGHMPKYAELHLVFENLVRVGRMVEQGTERRCRRCYVKPPLPRASVSS